MRPETVVRWHRQGFRLYWRWKSRSRSLGRPPIEGEIRELILEMHRANPTWGAPRIHGELSGRTMARTGLRMMPTFPSSSLKFRTAGFPQYGFKAGLSDEAFPSDLPVKPAPGMPFASHGLPSPFALSVVVTVSPLNVGPVTRWNAAIQGSFLPLPQRSSLRSGL